MSKPVMGYIKLQIPGGGATPAPPVGPALGQKGVNIMNFCREFNDETKDQQGVVIPVVITVYEDRSFSFVTKSPPAAVLLKRMASLAKGAARPHEEVVGEVTEDQIREIVEMKMKDLSAMDVPQGMKIIEGTARSMGIKVKK